MGFWGKVAPLVRVSAAPTFTAGVGWWAGTVQRRPGGVRSLVRGTAGSSSAEGRVRWRAETGPDARGTGVRQTTGAGD